jgi:transcription elongation factor SPT6
MDQLSEDELDLINENIGRDKKRLRKKADEDRDAVAQLFDDDDDDDQNVAATAEGSATAAVAPFREAELYEDSDDLDDFIIQDGSEAEMDEDERREQILRRKRERQEFAKNLGQDHGISDRYTGSFFAIS